MAVGLGGLYFNSADGLSSLGANTRDEVVGTRIQFGPVAPMMPGFPGRGATEVE